MPINPRDVANEQERAIDLISLVSEDITPKFEAFMNLIDSAGFDGSILVKVDTLQKKKAVNGLSIHFYMRGQPDDKSPFIVFPKPTTPTEEKVPPGRYWAHIINADGQLRMRREVAVDGNGPEKDIEVEIP